MKSRAAVAWTADQPLTIEEINVAGPQAGEVLVRLPAKNGELCRACHDFDD